VTRRPASSSSGEVSPASPTSGSALTPNQVEMWVIESLTGCLPPLNTIMRRNATAERTMTPAEDD
jgi:hypothetical protein